MERQNKYRKFQLQQKNIEDLERQSIRFKRVYSEYENMSDDLWKLENSEGEAVPDEFLEAMILQTSYLEDEIKDWLLQYNASQNEMQP